MITQSFQNINLESILELKENSTPEGKSLEYKLRLNIGSDAEKKEFLADIASFCNSGGGDLIYGVKENGNGEPEDILGIDVLNEDNLKLQIESLLRDSIVPRVPELNLKFIPVEGDWKLLVIRIPRSYLIPHQITFKKIDRFYSRGENGKFKLDYQQIKNFFLNTTDLENRINSFRQERLSKIASNTDIIPLMLGPKIVLHVIPLESFTDGLQVDLSMIRNDHNYLRPYGDSPQISRNSFDGFLSYANYGRSDLFDGKQCYVEIKNSGIIETAAVLRMHQDKETEILTLPSGSFSKDLIDTLQYYFDVLNKLQLSSRTLISLFLFDVKNIQLGTSKFKNWRFEQYQLERRMLDFPVLTLETIEGVKAENVVKEWLDQLWRAFGYDQCDYYDANGEYNYR